ncbi:MAG TPA: DUF4932 domain-containing protein [Mucilaginibacter sp.]|nr:DUF4932 domain-containing protein [Mucilaginibacter sp.]
MKITLPAKFLLCTILFSATWALAIAQVYQTSYPKTLVSPGPVYVRFSTAPDKYPIEQKGRDTIDIGTDGNIGLYAFVYYGKDSIRINYTKLPYKQVTYFPIQTPAGKAVLKLRFSDVDNSFPVSYIEKNSGKVQVEIPEVYELANIIWTFSPGGQKATDLYKTGDYYKRVEAYFKPYLNHPIFKKLDFPDSVYFEKYYGFRENSFAFNFKGDKIVDEGPYYLVFGDDFNTLFKQLLPLVEDFARKSKFRQFYKNNQAFYQKAIDRERQLLPIRNMWDWMENQFPANKYQAYKVVFSPLIGGSHSTQNFTTGYDNNKLFSEVVMFICATDRYEKPEYAEKQKEGLMSGVVFTEIDHNYVNPVTRRNIKRVNAIFAKRSFWADKVTGYNSPSNVFNEYMTHAVFCLWVLDTYDKQTADFVISARETLMVDKRHFDKFKEFDKALIGLHQKDKQVKVADLYPAILDWCEAQVK